MDPLLDRLRRRDPAAFQEAVVRYAGSLESVLFNLLRDRAEAEDLVQESFARLFIEIDRVRSPRAWLFQVGVNLARMKLRRKKPEVGMPAPAEPDPELKELLESALAALPEKTRAAFVLREVGGLTTDEVAEAERCTAGAVRQRITDARRKLREKLGRLLQLGSLL